MNAAEDLTKFLSRVNKAACWEWARGGRMHTFTDEELAEHDRDIERDTLRLMIEHFEVLEEDGPADEIRAVLRTWRADQ